MNPKKQTREEFEESSTESLKQAIDKAKELRDQLRLLEKDVQSKEGKIKNYQNIISEIRQELVKVQAKLYAGGTA